jgi:dTDP-4-dehydrorhamnose reductase
MRWRMTEPLELWGGLECTINRVGNCFFDQLARCGHYDRLEADLDRIASLGIRTLRYPALWEHVAARGDGRTDDADWSSCDVALQAMRARHIEPIVGLLHHGSGPPWTNLLHPGFAAGLAAYAGAFARRYPWVRFYTPINEPLTTARFSGLYGHWYPHRCDDRSFIRALLAQCRATVLAMQAIREVNPEAELIQTEDAGSTRATPTLEAQATFENARRWLSLDLMTGRVTPNHPLWSYAASAGETDLDWYQEHPVVPAVVGLNYYVTSDRFLDERLHRYPLESHGGNGRVRYADVEAARVDGVGIRGHAAVLEEAWRRYQVPVAIAEAHLGCSRDEQLRWLAEAWDGAHEARRRGADVRAVTAWALLGSWDWDSLVTRTAGHYEAGAFDVRSEPPRPTALAAMVKAIAGGSSFAHPVLTRPGWWRPESASAVRMSRTSRAAPLLILGVKGTLGRAFAHICETRRIPFVALSRQDLDITNPGMVHDAVAHHRPWAVVNAAGYVRVDEAQSHPRACRRVNAVAPSILAAVCRKAHARLLTFSSDLVFNGETGRPYLETDKVAPMNVYGHTKAEAEHRVLALAPSALVVRTSAFFGPWDHHNFVTLVLDALIAGRTFRAAADVTVSPTYVPDLVNASLDLLIDGAAGLWHLATDGEVTWAGFAERAAQQAGLSPDRIERCSLEQLQLPAARPKYSVLGSVHGRLLPTLEESIARYVHARQRVGTAA